MLIKLRKSMSFSQENFLGLPLTVGVSVQNICDLIDNGNKPQFITFINPAAWHLKNKYPEYLPALQQMTFVLPDGEGVALACRKMTGLPCPRVSFDMSSLAGSFF